MLTFNFSPVHSNPELMGGTLVFRGTRVPAQTLLDYLNDGFSMDEFIDMFPSVQRSDAEEFLRLAHSPVHAEKFRLALKFELPQHLKILWSLSRKESRRRSSIKLTSGMVAKLAAPPTNAGSDVMALATDIKIKFKQDNTVAAEMYVWVVWATITPFPGTASVTQSPVMSQYVTDLSPGWRFIADIEPIEITSLLEAERPNFAGGNRKPVPGKGKQHTTTPSLGDADSATWKWDMSRQMSVSIGNPALITKGALAVGLPSAWAEGQPIASYNPVPFPTNPVEGNDDPQIADEDSSPYTAFEQAPLAHGVGELSSADIPSFSMLQSWGEGATVGPSLLKQISASLPVWRYGMGCAPLVPFGSRFPIIVNGTTPS